MKDKQTKQKHPFACLREKRELLPYKVVGQFNGQVTVFNIIEAQNEYYNETDFKNLFNFTREKIVLAFVKAIERYQMSVADESNYFMKVLQKKTLSRLCDYGNEAFTILKNI